MVSVERLGRWEVRSGENRLATLAAHAYYCLNRRRRGAFQHGGSIQLKKNDLVLDENPLEIAF